MSESRCSKPHLHELLGAYELGILPEEEKISLEEHILRCDECFEDLYDTAPLWHITRSRAKRKTSRGRKWYIPAITAAVCLLAFTATFHYLSNEPATKRGRQISGSSITLIGPRGTQKETSLSFNWDSSLKASSYTLLVFDEKGDVIFSSETAQYNIEIDITREGPFEQNKTYYWKVEAKDDNGRLLSASPVSSFSIEAD